MSERLEEQVVNNRTVYEYLLPSEFYDHDHGAILYVVCSPVEVPFRAFQFVKNSIYHAFGIEHIHEVSKTQFSAISDF